MPLLFSHDQKQIIGRATNLRLEKDRTLRADLRFREGEAWDMVRDGDLQDVSVGYTIDEFEEHDEGLLATRWTPLEVSMVSIGADPGAGLGRSIEDLKMTEKTATIDREAVMKEGAKREAQRRSALARLFDGAGYEDLHARCVDEGLTLEASLDALTEARKAQPPQETIETRSGKVKHVSTPDQGAAMADAMLYRSGLFAHKKDLAKPIREAARGNQFMQYTIPDMARWCLREQGVSEMDMPRLPRDLVFRALETRAVAGSINSLTTDFTLLLANSLNKVLQTGWEEAEETYQLWTQTGSVPDFKQFSRIHLSQFDRLTLTAENNEYPLAENDDFAETGTAAKYGERVSISVEALANDDLSGFRIAEQLGVAARATTGDIAYAVLTDNGNMSDSNALFDEINHSNYEQAAGAAPSQATIYAMRNKMALQTDNHATEAHTLGIRMRYVLVPLELEDEARVAVESSASSTADLNAGVINPVTALQLQVIADHRLSADSVAQWYGAAARDTVEVTFVNGQSSPMISTEPNFSRSGVEWKVELYMTAIATDWRGLQANDGIT